MFSKVKYKEGIYFFTICRTFVMYAQRSCQIMRLRLRISLKSTCILMKKYAIALKGVVCILLCLFVSPCEHLRNQISSVRAQKWKDILIYIVTCCIIMCSSILWCEGWKWSVDPCSSEERRHDCSACRAVSPLHIGHWQLHQGSSDDTCVSALFLFT